MFVVLVLVFTFKSTGLPILLILVIQGSVWINFSFPYLQQEPLFFLSYLVVSSIQMGANIDYAIVIANRYVELKKVMPLKKAVIESLNQAFPTIITSYLRQAIGTLDLFGYSFVPASGKNGPFLISGKNLRIYISWFLSMLI